MGSRDDNMADFVNDQSPPVSSSGGFVVEGARNIKMFHLLQLKYALMLEMKGMHHSQGSVYAHVKRMFGFKGNKQKVLDQLLTHIEKEAAKP